MDLKTGEPKTKKKQKTNSGKAKIVLTEIMIQLLTKSPGTELSYSSIFARRSQRLLQSHRVRGSKSGDLARRPA